MNTQPHNHTAAQDGKRSVRNSTSRKTRETQISLEQKHQRLPSLGADRPVC